MPSKPRDRTSGAPTKRQIKVAPPSSEPLDKLIIQRPERVNLTPEETRARMEAFAAEREEAFIAAVREDPD